MGEKRNKEMENWGSGEKREISMIIGVVRVDLIYKGVFEYRLKELNGVKRDISKGRLR